MENPIEMDDLGVPLFSETLTGRPRGDTWQPATCDRPSGSVATCARRKPHVRRPRLRRGRHQMHGVQVRSFLEGGMT